MKRLLHIITIALLLTGCGEKNGGDNNGGNGGTDTPPAPSVAELICGEWHSTSLAVSGDIYLDFNDDKKFEMYQRIGEGAYRLYRGTWNIEENILTGKYNDGENWAASYDVAIEGKNLTLKSKNDAAEVTKYSSCTIPEEVKTGCEVVVKSSEAGL